MSHVDLDSKLYQVYIQAPPRKDDSRQIAVTKDDNVPACYFISNRQWESG